MKTLLKFLVVAAFLSVMALAPVYAQGPDACPMMKGCDKGSGAEDVPSLEDKFFEKAAFILTGADEIGLSEAQVEKVRELKHRIKRSLIVRDAEIEALALDVMSALYYKDDPDAGAVKDLIGKKYDVKKLKAQETAAALIELKGILSKDQMKKLKEVWSKKMEADRAKICPRCKMMEKHEHGEKTPR